MEDEIDQPKVHPDAVASALYVKSISDLTGTTHVLHGTDLVFHYIPKSDAEWALVAKIIAPAQVTTLTFRPTAAEIDRLCGLYRVFTAATTKIRNEVHVWVTLDTRYVDHVEKLVSSARSATNVQTSLSIDGEAVNALLDVADKNGWVIGSAATTNTITVFIDGDPTVPGVKFRPRAIPSPFDLRRVVVSGVNALSRWVWHNGTAPFRCIYHLKMGDINDDDVRAALTAAVPSQPPLPFEVDEAWLRGALGVVTLHACPESSYTKDTLNAFGRVFQVPPLQTSAPVVKERSEEKEAKRKRLAENVSEARRHHREAMRARGRALEESNVGFSRPNTQNRIDLHGWYASLHLR